jgi:hypothetical protein
MPVTIGPFTNVPAPGDPVTSAWAQQLTQYAVDTRTADPPAWIAPTFQNGWGDFGGGFVTAGYRKIGDIVYLRGFISGGTIAAACFTLPLGYRPAQTHRMSSVSYDVFCEIEISASSAGVIALTGNSGWVSLSNIQFDVSPSVMTLPGGPP